MYRVHDATYAASAFYRSPAGIARFGPIRDEAGVEIPTLYAATTPRGATYSLQSLFQAGLHKQDGWRSSSGTRLPGGSPGVDLSRVALRKFGVATSRPIVRKRSCSSGPESILPKSYLPGIQYL
jgi:hypothetical protein